jgi:hypothetical protein
MGGVPEEVSMRIGKLIKEPVRAMLSQRQGLENRDTPPVGFPAGERE